MSIRIPTSILSIVSSIMFSAGLIAQEQTEVTIQVKKDGKVIQDTTYQFDDADEARHAVMMMEVLSGHGEGMEHVTYNYTSTHPGSSHSKAMVFISEDGETTKIEEFHGDSLVWVNEEEGDHVKVMKYKMKEGDHPQGEHVIVMKSEDGNTFDVLVDEESDEEENIYIIEGDDDMGVEMKKIMKKYDGVEGANVKVIVITTDENEDMDHDVEVDTDQDIDVEVKVIKKKQTIEKK